MRIYRAGRFYVTAISQWLTDRVRDSMLHGVQCRLISNAIDLAVFKPGDQSEARRQLGCAAKVRIVTLTAHNRFKDYDLVESALLQVKSVNGDGLLSICLGKAAESCTVGEARMVYPGFERDPKRMALYYRAFRRFIHAAKDEAFGKTIAEAMACGTPVVATAVGGIPELLQHEVTGYLVPPGDSAAIAQRVQQLLSDQALRRLLGERAAIVARQRFDLNRQVDAFLGWYQEVLDHEARRNALSCPH